MIVRGSVNIPEATKDKRAPVRAATEFVGVTGQMSMTMLIRGSVDVVETTEVRGWAYSPNRRDPVRVQAVLNHEILGEALANIHRPDLAAAGLGDGKSGYAIKLFRPIDPIYLPFLTVKVDDGDAELPRAPALGFRDFFAALFRKHPAAGRSRSLFGGLWTDRSDAAAVLRGKVAIGQVPDGVAASVGHLIHDGASLLDLAAAPAEADWRPAIGTAVGDLLDDAAVLPMLRTVLDDNPLALRAVWLAGSGTGFAQPSTGNPAPSPAECLALVVPFGAPVTLEVVRGSHCLPEFTPSGVSRWANGESAASLELAAGHGLLDSHALAAGSVAVIGPGTLYRVRFGAESQAAQILCVPVRQTPLDSANRASTSATIRPSGVRVLI